MLIARTAKQGGLLPSCPTLRCAGAEPALGLLPGTVLCFSTHVGDNEVFLMGESLFLYGQL